jgi:hypothetical protein
MDPKPDDPNSLDLPPEEKAMQNKTRNEWWFTYIFVAILVLIIMARAYNLTHTH